MPQTGVYHGEINCPVCKQSVKVAIPKDQARVYMKLEHTCPGPWTWTIGVRGVDHRRGF